MQSCINVQNIIPATIFQRSRINKARSWHRQSSVIARRQQLLCALQKALWEAAR